MKQFIVIYDNQKKEVMLDGSPDWNDFKAGMLGCGISVISFQLTYTIQYKN